MPVFIFDQDALERIAKVEHETFGIDPQRFVSDEYQSSMGPSSFKAFLDAWNPGPGTYARIASAVFIPLESSPPSNESSPSTAIMGYGGYHRYFVDSTTGEILFHLAFSRFPEAELMSILEKYGFNTLGSLAK